MLKRLPRASARESWAHFAHLVQQIRERRHDPLHTALTKPSQDVCVARPGVASVRGVARRTTRRVVRRSDMMLKHDISLLGHLDNGLGFYRFSYNGSDKAYVGVMAQEVQTVMPEAVLRGSDGYLRVFYDKLGLKFQSYEQWTASGAHVPAGTPIEQ